MPKSYPHMKYLRSDILNHLIKKFNYNSYLEIGTRDIACNFNKVHILNKDSIDPNPRSGEVTYKLTSDDAFKIIKKTGKTYDLIFIDGLHTEEQVDKDIINSLQVLNKNGTIVLHDCNPVSKDHQVQHEIYLKRRGHWNGTVWKSIAKLRCTRADLDVCVVDTDWGCGIVRKGTQKLYRTTLNVLDYDYLEKNRTELLNLISVETFIKKF